MTAYSWLYSVSGDWSNGFDWYGGVPNNAAVNVTIATAGVYTVTIGATENIAVGSLNLDYASATLLVDGTLNLTRTLFITAGALDLNGTINGGTINTKSSTLNIQTGVLNGVKVAGGLLLNSNAYHANLTIEGGLVMTGILGKGNGTIALTGIGSALVFDGSQSVDGATIYFGSYGETYGNNYYDATISTSDAGSAATLTLDANVKIIGSGAYAQIFANQTDGAIVNNGSITATAKNGQFYIGEQLGGSSGPQPGAGAFTNNGSVSVSNGDALIIAPTVFTNSAGATLTAGAGSELAVGYVGAGTVNNNGAISASTDDTLTIEAATFTNSAGATLTVGAGSTLDIGYAGSSWSNAGTITATGATVDFNGTWTNTGTLNVSSSTVNLGASLTGATLNQFAGQSNSIIVTGTVANGGSVLSVGAGTGLGAVALDGGTITGGTIADSGGGLAFSKATLDGVTYEGALNLGAPSSSLTVKDGIVLTGAGGSGAGSINLTGTSSALVFSGAQTLNNATVTLGSSASNGYAVLGVSDDGSPAALMLGKKLNIVGSGLYASIDSASPDATILNAGSISATATGGQFTIGGGALAFINTGSLSVSNGDILTIDASTYDNTATGTITAAVGSAVNLSVGTNAGTLTANGAALDLGGLTNTGTLTANGATLNGALINTGTVTANGATLYLGRWVNFGTVTANGATIYVDAAVTNTGAFDITDSTVNLEAYNLTDSELELFGGEGNSLLLSGSLGNSGETLSVGAGTALGTVVINGGNITGGTIADSGDGLSIIKATLTQVAYQGTVDLSAAGSSLTVDVGMTFAGAGGSGAGTVDLTGAASVLTFVGSQTLSNATIDISNGATLQATDTGSPTLTFANTLNIVASGLQASIYVPAAPYRPLAATIVNNGAISATASGGELFIYGAGAFTNNGSITASNGATIVINVKKFSGNGGTYEADAGSAIQFDYGSGNAGPYNSTFILNGAGSTIEYQGSNGSLTPIDAYQTTIGSAGALKLLGGRNFTSAFAFTDGGALVLENSTFTVGGLTVVAGGTLSGSGTVAAAVSNSGLIEASGGMLTLQGAVTGTGGTYEADAGSTIQLGSETITEIDAATFILNGAASAFESGDGAYLTATLTTIGATGVLQLLGGRNFTTTLDLSDGGALVLGGGTFTAASLTVSAGGSLSGSGAVAAAIANSGVIEASGGTLTLQNAVTGTGGLKIDAGATLTLGSTLAAGGTATFNGATADLAITAVSSFADTIAGLAATDEIDLLKTAATSAVVNGANQLVVTDNGAAVATFQLSGTTSGLAFTTTSDGNGGTFIVAGAAPAPHANLALFRQYVAAGFGDHATPLLDRQDHLQMAQPHHDLAAGH